MNEIVNKFLLAGDKFMPEMHPGQSEFTHDACGQFPRNKERIQKFKETGDSRCIYQNELDKACFQHDIAYGDCKIYQEEELTVKYVMKYLISLKYVGYGRGLASVVHNFFDKMSVLLKVKLCQTKNYQKNYTNQLLDS